MQPTLPQNTGSNDMDLPAAQSMDWLFKKERIYLLAQFWQQRATLAEKEVNTLKEQLTSTATTIQKQQQQQQQQQTAATTITQNGVTEISSSPSSPTSDNNINCLNNNINSKLLNNNNINNNNNNNNNNKNNNNLNNNNNNKTEELIDDDEKMDEQTEQINNNNCTTTPSSGHINLTNDKDSDSNISSSNNNNNSNINNNNSNINNNNSSTRTSLTEDMDAKDKEISALVEEVSRLRSAISALQESHQAQIQRLEDRIDAKRQHILRLEARIDDNQSEYDEVIIRKENNILRSVDLSPPPSESKQFQELLLERTKALAAQTAEALKSSNSDGSLSTVATPVHHLQNPQTSSSPSTPPPQTQPPQTQSSSSINNTRSSTPITLIPIQSNGLTTPLPTTTTTSITTPTTPSHLTNNNNNNNNNSLNSSTSSITSSLSTTNNNNNPLIHPPSLQNVETFGSFLGEEIVSNWRRGLELPPPPPSVLLRSNMLLNHQQTSPSADGHHQHQQQQQQQQLQQQLQQQHLQHLHHHHNSHHDDKTSSHHDTSSRASTPALQDSRIEENMNGMHINSMSLPISKSPLEDNNNTLGSLTHPGGLIPGLPFQFQERGHFRFADDLQMPPGSMVGRLGDSLIPKGDPMEARLQEMLRYNMDKYSNQSLDTLHISRRVRELLSVHNIGQRLFAKYVLGLSQGTVSELLSKPKPWDKLTEKGRDSYRKMHAWACDDNAVMLLKSLIPKKGKDSGMSQYGRPDGDITDERIQHILGEAANLMKTPTQQQQQQQQQHQQQQHQHQQQQQQQHHSIKQEDSHSTEDSKSPHNNLDCESPFSKEAQLRKLKKYDNDDISQDKVARIYQEELAKLMTRAPPNGGMPPNQMPDDNIRIALEAYHRELAKLQQTGANLPNFPNFPGLLALQQQAINGAQDLSLPKEKLMKMNGQQLQQQQSLGMLSETESIKDSEDSNRHSGSAFSLVRPKQEPNTPTPTTTTSVSSAAPSPLGNNTILPPAITPNQQQDDFSSAASPLQRMASITNSLITQPPVTPHHSSPQRPLKAVLPPITQQQFDMFNNLNTEDIVRRVKEALSQYSISQRLFGESVLGLSQGSVSDLLARPKPWHMLTQKGREPFIRMKMFLEDDNAVHKLVASQYKIAPEKLMRTGSYSGSPQIPSTISKQMPMMPKMLGDTFTKMQHEHVQQQHQQQHQQQQQHAAAQQAVAVAVQQQQQQQQAAAQQHHMMQQLQSSPMSHNLSTTPQPQTMLLTPPGLPPHHAIALAAPQEKKSSSSAAAAAAAAMSMPPVHSPQQANVMRGMHQHMSPTVYEMAALTQDLDTQIITTKIKEALLANNIGQKIFGEAVLGLSQGSVSELLSKPKPWHMLSIKGREPFIRMQLWLADANNVDRLQALKNERREANKRRRSTGAGAQDNSSDTSSNDTSEFYHSHSPGPASVGSSTGPPNKKQRVLFSEEQKEALRLAFALDPYPNVATIEFLATELGLSTRTITNWFHNHRMRLKQQVPHGAPSEPVPTRESQTGAPFDQNQFRVLLHQRLMELQKERMGLSGVPLPYTPYFAANPNLAALIGRGLIPADANFAALNNAFKEQMNGLDLSMGSLKRDGEDDYDDMDGDGDGDDDGRDGEGDDSHLSDSESMDGVEIQKQTTPKTTISLPSNARSSRRKPAAPQWVNPDWQDDKMPLPPGVTQPTADEEVIINGVCVMQQASDYSRLSSEETVRIEPIAVERFDGRSDNDDNDDDDDDDNADPPKPKPTPSLSPIESDNKLTETKQTKVQEAIRATTPINTKTDIAAADENDANDDDDEDDNNVSERVTENNHSLTNDITNKDNNVDHNNDNNEDDDDDDDDVILQQPIKTEVDVDNDRWEY